MSDRERKRENRRTRRKDASPEPFFDAAVSKEKNRARELRNSPWWRRKIQSGKCHYCSRQFRPVELTMDHVVPIARGGKSEKINLVPACKECNNKKKYLLPVEWEEYMAGMRSKE